jgi:hypothetical protein
MSPPAIPSRLRTLLSVPWPLQPFLLDSEHFFPSHVPSSYSFHTLNTPFHSIPLPPHVRPFLTRTTDSTQFFSYYNSSLMALNQKWTVWDKYDDHLFPVLFQQLKLACNFANSKRRFHMQMGKLSDQWLRIRHRSSVRINLIWKANLENCSIASVIVKTVKNVYFEKNIPPTALARYWTEVRCSPSKWVYIYFHFRP